MEELNPDLSGNIQHRIKEILNTEKEGRVGQLAPHYEGMTNNRKSPSPVLRTDAATRRRRRPPTL